MKRLIVFMIACNILTGCFKEPPKVPQYDAKQHIDIAVDTLICFSALEDFDSFIITNSLPHDSVQWFANYSNWQGDYLGNDSSITIEVGVWQNENIGCIGYSNGTRIEYVVRFYYCGRFVFIPTAFTVLDNGLNDSWYPLVSTNGAYNTFSIYWEVRNLDGFKLFESTEANNSASGWNGFYNGTLMPRGAYLFYIELTFTGEDPIEYTGWFEMLE